MIKIGLPFTDIDSLTESSLGTQVLERREEWNKGQMSEPCCVRQYCYIYILYLEHNHFNKLTPNLRVCLEFLSVNIKNKVEVVTFFYFVKRYFNNFVLNQMSSFFRVSFKLARMSLTSPICFLTSSTFSFSSNCVSSTLFLCLPRATVLIIRKDCNKNKNKNKKQNKNKN